jgi:hypothetical protein
VEVEVVAKSKDLPAAGLLRAAQLDV